MAISAKDVSELRKSTGAGMMDCKKALEESGGDLEGALDYLRKKGQKVAAKRADREANEGVVVALAEGDKGVLLALSCETDFVAKNEDHMQLAEKIAKAAMEKGLKTKEEVSAMEFDGATVAEKLVERTGTVGEKIEVADFQVVEGEQLASYIHAGSKIGVLVSYKDGGKDDAPQFFRSLAMHIAAMSPSILTPDEFDAEFVAKETEALQGQIKVENEDRQRLGKPLKNVPQYASRKQLTDEVMAAAEAAIKEELKAEGKPEKIWDKIVPGKLERFVADNTLLDQDKCLLSQFYALDDTKTVEAAIAEFSDGAEVIAFKRVSVGG
ncbi:translation elongation factor Ts [Rhodopirellula sp. MGV]|uniref:translation elongation factor Ts n=1 Tax=Rhodopirellula sp. MGV TaxID=2023130 RepID=UPI000B95E7B3|nr:translation elongation factor Ts [Rhodopirellula sp. MGV]OYP35428.1 translation elongation factor Ts [Rhodopirellula sp. MGV]PNY33868.1 elongation factor Ts [Rhodopirellula baltica]